jgi:hypothetical protein
MEYKDSFEAASLGRTGLPPRLRGVLLPEICRVADLVEHTGLPPTFWCDELDAGRLRGRRLHGTDDWLIHRHAVVQWLTSTAD